MLISTDWIRDFVDLPDLSPQELYERFTIGSAEVEGVEIVGEHFEKIKIAKIKSFEPHPEADKLNLVTFEFGGSETARVVCGAPNVREGLVTAYAAIGVTLPGGFTLEPKKIRGVLSEGMLCSESELGLSTESDGIIELPEDAPVGQTLLEYLKETKDVVLDVDNKSLTHRPDLWGHYGLAREFSALWEKPLKNPYDESWASKLKTEMSGSSPIKVKVDKKSACRAYFGLSVDGVTVGESPAWMQRRLNAVGLRPINSIVDISNYVMLELGMPNHLFDRDLISGGEVVIEEIKEKTQFKTLDEVDRELVPGDSVIRDTKETLVIGGIMGGLNSGVTEKTKNIFIEVANWVPERIRMTSTRLGLRTDSSQRYEKNLDSLLCERTLLRILELVKELNPAAKVNGVIEYDGNDLTQIETLKINTSVEKIQRVLGLEVPESRIVSIFESLDFRLEKSGGNFEVTVPSYRATKDVECEEDLIEEIGRVVGYGEIPTSSPKLDISPVRLSPKQELHRKLRDHSVTSARALEIMTYPMVGHKLYEKAMWPHQLELELVNALSKENSIMRNSMVPSFLETAAMNAKNFDQFRCFEIGRVYLADEKNFATESSHYLLGFYDREQSPFMDLLNTVEDMLSNLQVPADLMDQHPKFKNLVVPENWAGMHPFEFQNIRVMGKMQGAVMSVHPLVLKGLKIKGHLSFALINLGAFEERPLKDKTKYHSLPKFPGSDFDWTVILKSEQKVGEALEALKKVKIKELQKIEVVANFKLSDTENALTLRAKFLDPEKTLSGEFLDHAKEKVIGCLDAAGFPLKM